MQRGVAFVIARVDVRAQLLDQVLHRREHAARRVAMGVGGEAFAVADAGGGQQRRHAGTAGRDRRQPETSRDLRGVSASPVAGRPGGLIVGIVGSAPYDDQQLHRVDVGAVGGAPERRGADFVDARLVEVVARVPDLLVRRAVRIRARRRAAAS